MSKKGGMTSGQLDLERKFNELLQERAKLRAEEAAELRSQSETQSGILDLFGESEKATSKSADSQSLLADTLDSVASSAGAASKSMNPFSEALGIVKKSAASLKIGLESLYNFIQPFYSIITLQPIYDWMYEQSAAMGGANTAAFEAAQTLKEAIGTLPKTMEKYTRFADAAAKSTAGFGRSLSSIFGYEVGDVTKALAGYVEELGVEFDLFMDQIEGAEGHFIAFNKGLNISVESLTKLTYRFEDTEAAYNDFAKGLIGGSKELGLNIKAVGKNFDAALKNSADFGYMTRKELTATTLYATRLGLEMDELTGMTKKFDTFEGAAEAVGKLNTAFGIQLDTMDMVMETNPAKRLDMIRSALEGSGQSLDTIMGDPRKARYLSESLGMTFDQIQKLATVKTDEFGFTEALDAAEEGQKKMSDNDAMNEMVKQIRELNRSMGGGGQTYKGFFSAFVKGFKEGLERTRAFRVMFGQMQKAFAAFYDVGAKVAHLVAALFYNPRDAGKESPTGKILTAEDAPLFKYFFKPFLDYFKAMQTAAETLMADGGPVDKVYRYVQSLLDPETYGPADKNFNIFETLFAPFKDISKPSLLTPEIREGFIKLAGVLGDALGDAMRFIGNRAVSWVDGLFKATTNKTDLGNMDSFTKMMKKFGEDIMDGFGDMMAKISKAAGGLRVYLFGGTSGTYSYPKEKSLFHRLFGGAREDVQRGFEDAGIFDEFLSGLVQGFAQMIGDKELDEVFGRGGSSIGSKFKFLLAKVRFHVYEALAEHVKEMAAFGVRLQNNALAEMSDVDMALIATLPDAAAALINPAYFFGGVLASMDGAALEKSFKAAAQDAKQDMMVMKSDMKRREREHTNFLKNLAAAGLPQDAQDAVAEIKKQYGSAVEIGPEDARQMVEVNQASLEMVAAELEDRIKQEKDNDTYNEIGKLLGQGYYEGVNETIPLTEEATAALLEGNLALAKKLLGIESPSIEYMIIGQYMADGLIAGFFGDDQLIPGSAVNGFKVRFAQEMTKLSDEIDDHYNDLGNSAIVAIETKLGKIGRILRAEQPMRVEVNTNKLQVNASFKITLDSAQLGAVMASDPKGSFFALNEKRFGGGAPGTTNRVTYRDAYRNYRRGR